MGVKNYLVSFIKTMHKYLFLSGKSAGVAILCLVIMILIGGTIYFVLSYERNWKKIEMAFSKAESVALIHDAKGNPVGLIINKAAQIEQIVEKMAEFSNLTCLLINNCDFSGRDCQSINKISHVKAIVLTDVKFTSDIGVLKNVNSIAIMSRHSQYLPTECEILLQSPQIKEITIGNYDMSDIQKKTFFSKKISDVEVLRISRSNFYDEDVALLQNLKNLRELNLSEVKITGGTLGLLSKLEHIESVSLAKNNLVDIRYKDFILFRALLNVNCAFSIIPAMELRQMQNDKKIHFQLEGVIIR